MRCSTCSATLPTSLPCGREDRPTASVLSLYHDGTVMPFWGGGVFAARNLRANERMYYELMLHARRKGCTRFDFGRSKTGSGPFSFKKNWGFEPEPLIYRSWSAPKRAARTQHRSDRRGLFRQNRLVEAAAAAGSQSDRTCHSTRSRLMGETLFLGHRVPFPPDRGDKIRSHHLLKGWRGSGRSMWAPLARARRTWRRRARWPNWRARMRLSERSKPLPLAGLEALLANKPGQPRRSIMPPCTAMSKNARQPSYRYDLRLFRSDGAICPRHFVGRVIVDLVRRR